MFRFYKFRWVGSFQPPGRLEEIPHLHIQGNVYHSIVYSLLRTRIIEIESRWNPIHITLPHTLQQLYRRSQFRQNGSTIYEVDEMNSPPKTIQSELARGQAREAREARQAGVAPESFRITPISSNNPGSE